MIRLLKLEFCKIKYVYIISLLLGIIYSGVIIIPHLSGYQYFHNIEIWDETNEIFTLIFPLMAVLPTCWLMYYERKNKFFSYTLIRVSSRRYLFSKYLVSTLGGALIVFLISFVGLIITLYFVPGIEPNPSSKGYDYALRNFFGFYFVNKPFIYGTVLSLWRAFIGAVVVTFAFVLSLYINNIFVILTGSFVYSILENFTLAVLGVPYYRLVTSFNPNNLTPSAVSVPRLLVGPFLLVFLTILIIIYFKWIKKASLY